MHLNQTIRYQVIIVKTISQHTARAWPLIIVALTADIWDRSVFDGRGRNIYNRVIKHTSPKWSDNADDKLTGFSTVGGQAGGIPVELTSCTDKVFLDDKAQVKMDEGGRKNWGGVIANDEKAGLKSSIGTIFVDKNMIHI